MIRISADKYEQWASFHYRDALIMLDDEEPDIPYIEKLIEIGDRYVASAVNERMKE